MHRDCGACDENANVRSWTGIDLCICFGSAAMLMVSHRSVPIILVSALPALSSETASIYSAPPATIETTLP